MLLARISRGTKKLFFVLLFLLSFLTTYVIPLFAIPTAESFVAPDWNKITFASFGAIDSNGAVVAPIDVIQDLGYDPSRIWQKGFSAAEVLKLGDFSPTELSDFALSTVADFTGIDLGAIEQLSLDKFDLTAWQTWGSLSQAIPGLDKIPIGQIKPAIDFFSSLGAAEIPLNASIVEAIGINPSLGQIPLGDVLNLSNYSIADIPFLSNTSFNQFFKWQESFIGDIPGLQFVSFGSFLDIFATQTVRFDKPWEKESGDPNIGDDRFVSGSAIKGKVTPKRCPSGERCDYLALTNPPGTNSLPHQKNFVGQRIAWGQQQVEGGYGPLKKLNGGKEPTGYLPFGHFVKVAVKSIDQSDGSADLEFYFPICGQPYVDSCSPYFVGGFPYRTLREKDLMIISGASRPKNLNLPQNLARRRQEALMGMGYDNTIAYADIPPGEINQRIIDSAIANQGMPTDNRYSPAATKNGRLSCAWAVNEVLKDAGIKPLGANQLHVLSVERDLQNGRGVAVAPSDARAGDIVLVDRPGTAYQHIGVCLNNGCTKAISNSSAAASFSWISDGHFSPTYTGARRSIYRVTN